MEEQYKICVECGEEKFLKDFNVDNRARDGRMSKCRNCYNEYIRFSRIAKKRKGSNRPEKLISESEEFKNTVVEFLESCYKNKEIDMDFLDNLRGNIIRIHEKIHFPPTNKFKIYSTFTSNDSSFGATCAIIKSKLSLFLALKKNKIDIPIKISKGIEYDMDHALIVMLPEDLKLTNEEVKEFSKSLFAITNENLKNSLEIKEEGVDLSCVVKEIPNIVQNLLFEFDGREMNSFEVAVHFQGMDNIIVKWPKEFSVNEDIIREIKTEIYKYIIGME